MNHCSKLTLAVEVEATEGPSCRSVTVCQRGSAGEEKPVSKVYPQNIGLAQRAEQIHLQAQARGNATFNFSEASRLAREEFTAGGRDPNRPIFAEHNTDVFDLPQQENYAVINAGRAARIDALLAQAAMDGRQLAWRDASAIVTQFEEWKGWNPHKPVTFTEAQGQALVIRGEKA